MAENEDDFLELYASPNRTDPMETQETNDEKMLLCSPKSNRSPRTDPMDVNQNSLDDLSEMVEDSDQLEDVQLQTKDDSDLDTVINEPTRNNFQYNREPEISETTSCMTSSTVTAVAEDTDDFDNLSNDDELLPSLVAKKPIDIKSETIHITEDSDSSIVPYQSETSSLISEGSDDTVRSGRIGKTNRIDELLVHIARTEQIIENGLEDHGIDHDSYIKEDNHEEYYDWNEAVVPVDQENENVILQCMSSDVQYKLNQIQNACDKQIKAIREFAERKKDEVIEGYSKTTRDLLKSNSGPFEEINKIKKNLSSLKNLLMESKKDMSMYVTANRPNTIREFKRDLENGRREIEEQLELVNIMLENERSKVIISDGYLVSQLVTRTSNECHYIKIKSDPYACIGKKRAGRQVIHNGLAKSIKLENNVIVISDDVDQCSSYSNKKDSLVPCRAVRKNMTLSPYHYSNLTYQGGKSVNGTTSLPSYNNDIRSFNFHETEGPKMTKLFKDINTSQARFMSVSTSKKHRKDLLICDIKDNQLLHYNFDRDEACIIRGKGNLKSPGSCCFIDDPSGQLMYCTLDYEGICVFDSKNLMLWEIKLENKPTKMLSRSHHLPSKYIGLWWVTHTNRKKHLVTLDRKNKYLVYFVPFVPSHDQTEANPAFRSYVDCSYISYVRFGCYDEREQRFLLTADDKGRYKKIISINLDGRLSPDFGNNGVQAVPADVQQIAGICPVAPDKMLWNGYLICDSLGKKILHMNKDGEFRKVEVFGANSDLMIPFGRPVSICSNSRFYAVSFHPVRDNRCPQETFGACVKLFAAAEI